MPRKQSRPHGTQVGHNRADYEDVEDARKSRSGDVVGASDDIIEISDEDIIESIDLDRTHR